MTWGYQKKGKLPLNNKVGYHAMIQQIKAQKDLSALIVVVALPLPQMPQTKHRMEEVVPVVEHHGQDDETLWGQKLTVEGWCNKHNLGDEACKGLVKLGFQVGDKLDALDKDTWAWAGLGPLHQQHILAVYSAEKGA
ncbi:hypothetical protein L208DRAFT_1375786 [Tricholoma matsutake]|nr:hypothetical protein L208DRAFT_1375786 [Tricholoma matsutake 945]